MKNKHILFDFSIYIAPLLIGCVINSLLTVSSFETSVLNALSRQLLIQGRSTVYEITASLNVGKRITDIESLVRMSFKRLQQRNPAIGNLCITDAQQIIVYSSDTQREGSILAENLQRVSVPFCAADSSFSGIMHLEVSTPFLHSMTMAYIYRIMIQGICIVFAALCVLAIVLYCVTRTRRRTVLCIITLFVSQSVFAVMNMYAYNNRITAICIQNNSILGDSLENIFTKTLAYITRYQNITGIEEFLRQTLAENVECSRIVITDECSVPVVDSAAAGGVVRDHTAKAIQTDADWHIRSIKDSAGTEYTLMMQTNRKYIYSLLLGLFQNTYIIVAAGFVFTYITREFLLLCRNRRKLFLPAQIKNRPSAALHLIRVTSFMTLFAGSLSVSFLPAYIMRICAAEKFPSWLSAETAAGIPAESYIAGILAALFVLLFAVRKVPLRARLISFAVLFTAGSLGAAFIQSFWGLIAARFICGMGYGGILFSLSVLIIGTVTEDDRNKGFGANAAAGAAASFAAVSVGGEIVQHWGYEAGFMFSALCMLCFIIFVITYVPVLSENNRNEKSFSAADFFQVLRSRGIILYLVCINVPFQFVYWGLFQFFLPLYMSDILRFSAEETGSVLGVFSLISLASGLAGQAAGSVQTNRILLSAGAFIAGLSLILLGIWPHSWILCILALVCMGVDNLFVDALEEGYISSLGNCKLSDDCVLLCYRAAEKSISVFIPLCISIYISAWGYGASFTAVGTCLAAGAVLFFTNCLFYKQKSDVDNSR